MTDGGPTPQMRAAARAALPTDASVVAETASPVPKRRFHWVRAASDRLPTSWFAGISTALLLAVTAAFGGLATVEPPGLTQTTAGIEHRSEQFALTVEGAQLQDADPDVGIYLDEGERMLSIRVRVENLWTEPQFTGALDENVQIDGLSLADARAVRVDDATPSERLQPGIPVELDFRLIVGAEDFHAGDTLHVTLHDLSLYTGSFVLSGTSWSDPRPVAELTLTIRDPAEEGSA